MVVDEGAGELAPLLRTLVDRFDASAGRLFAVDEEDSAEMRAPAPPLRADASIRDGAGTA